MSSDSKDVLEEKLAPEVDEVASLLNQTAEMDGDGGEQIVTMQDVLDEQDELEKEYAAVLGGSDHKCCTYSKVLEYSFFFLQIYLIQSSRGTSSARPSTPV